MLAKAFSQPPSSCQIHRVRQQAGSRIRAPVENRGAVRTWMSVRRGPTERDRSEGTPTEEGPNQKHKPLAAL